MGAGRSVAGFFGVIPFFFPQCSESEQVGEDKKDTNSKEGINFDHACGVAIHRLNASVTEFYEMTPVEFDHALKDHQQMESIKLRETGRGALRANRVLAMWMYNMNPYRKRVMKRPEDMGYFSWEKQQQEQQTLDQMELALQVIYNSAKAKGLTG